MINSMFHSSIYESIPLDLRDACFLVLDFCLTLRFSSGNHAGLGHLSLSGHERQQEGHTIKPGLRVHSLTGPCLPHISHLSHDNVFLSNLSSTLQVCWLAVLAEVYPEGLALSPSPDTSAHRSANFYCWVQLGFNCSIIDLSVMASAYM